jgi:ribosomal protein L37AE/L43A
MTANDTRGTFFLGWVPATFAGWEQRGSQMRELFRAAKEECPACHTANVRKVARIDPAFGQHSPTEPATNELWACADCAVSFIKGPARARWAGLLVDR